MESYDPREDKEASIWEKNYYDFLISCHIAGDYKAGLIAIKQDEEDLPQYMIDKFKPEFERKIKEGNLAKRTLNESTRSP